MEAMHLGVPVAVTVEFGPPHRLRPQWYTNYIARDTTIPTTQLEHSIHIIWNPTSATFVFPDESTHIMFLLKWG
jgi:hypothetical protein